MNEDKEMIAFQKASEKVAKAIDAITKTEEDLWVMCEPALGMEVVSLKHEGITYQIYAIRN